jgi:hypothetical protein
MALDTKTSEALVLGGAERAVDIDEVVADRASAPPTELAEDLSGELAVAGPDLDHIEGFVFDDPASDEFGKRAAEGGEGREISARADITDAGRVVAELRVVKRLAHEALEGQGAAGYFLQS